MDHHDIVNFLLQEILIKFMAETVKRDKLGTKVYEGKRV
jgi:hypothetical protein